MTVLHNCWDPCHSLSFRNTRCRSRALVAQALRVHIPTAFLMSSGSYQAVHGSSERIGGLQEDRTAPGQAAMRAAKLPDPVARVRGPLDDSRSYLQYRASNSYSRRYASQRLRQRDQGVVGAPGVCSSPAQPHGGTATSATGPSQHFSIAAHSAQHPVMVTSVPPSHAGWGDGSGGGHEDVGGQPRSTSQQHVNRRPRVSPWGVPATRSAYAPTTPHDTVVVPAASAQPPSATPMPPLSSFIPSASGRRSSGERAPDTAARHDAAAIIDTPEAMAHARVVPLVDTDKLSDELLADTTRTAWERVVADQRDIEAVVVAIRGVRLQVAAAIAEREAIVSETRVAKVRANLAAPGMREMPGSLM